MWISQFYESVQSVYLKIILIIKNYSCLYYVIYLVLKVLLTLIEDGFNAISI